MAGDRDIQNLTRSIKDMTQVFKDLARVTEALNKNLVEIERNRRARAGFDDLFDIHPRCFTAGCTPKGAHHPDCEIGKAAGGPFQSGS